MSIETQIVWFVIVACGVAFLLGASAAAGGKCGAGVARRARRAAVRHHARLRAKRATRTVR